MAERVPSIEEGLALVTRLSAAEVAEGCTNRVVSPEAMEKSFQLMMARSVVWLTVKVEPLEPMVAEPEVTTPPDGLAQAAGTARRSASPTRNARQHKSVDRS
ncbi:MAG: hypothetical protein CO113_16470 [Elusimicrobia bacterium CG_4_9_14_3_um_filter_62_55]|nr:MAG: hypothetical protein COR54_18390 [Elusimicrobia bacterium CG22_combo_CG10-13_8_21_14_all_63_91]PJA18061.1 MAG: hypothetical protein COX66_02560 [Elusimicrobia bacterium CG_4_10_14_0_2_um_filter_63_34]PJB23917.1 MAG: hypothetical protein CO113_16470 [Elusimicrobia bacterium CG_4_9_14_3_um_filter_62_55]